MEVCCIDNGLSVVITETDTDENHKGPCKLHANALLKENQSQSRNKTSGV